MYKVEIHNLEIFAFIGFYPEEQIFGSYFYVDVSIEFPSIPSNLSGPEDLSNVLNYEKLAQIVIKEFKIKRKLIESTGAEIMNQLNVFVKNKDMESKPKIYLKIKKKSPTIGGKVEYSGITFTN